MAIVKNQSKTDFSIIPNKLINDTSLSLEAKMMYIYIASKPDNWNIIHSEIQKSLNIKSKTTMAKYANELENSGWISREKLPSGSYLYTLNSNPVSPKNGRPKNGLGSPKFDTPSPRNEPDPSPYFSNCQKMDPNKNKINKIDKNIDNNTNFLKQTPRELLNTFLQADITFTEPEKTALADLVDFKKLTMNDGVVIRNLITLAKKFKFERATDSEIVVKACQMCISTSDHNARFVLPFAKNKPFNQVKDALKHCNSQDFARPF